MAAQRCSSVCVGGAAVPCPALLRSGQHTGLAGHYDRCAVVCMTGVARCSRRLCSHNGPAAVVSPSHSLARSSDCESRQSLSNFAVSTSLLTARSSVGAGVIHMETRCVLRVFRRHYFQLWEPLDGAIFSFGSLSHPFDCGRGDRKTQGSAVVIPSMRSNSLAQPSVVAQTRRSVEWGSAHVSRSGGWRQLGHETEVAELHSHCTDRG